MTNKRTQVENIGEAISVLIQTAEVAQKAGILSLDDAVIVKSSIDFLMAMNQAQTAPQPSTEELLEEGPRA
jgi:hypothetical protein